MTRRGIVFGLVIAIIVLLLAGGLWIRQWWQATREAQGIEQLDWRGLDVGLSHLGATGFRLQLDRSGRRWTISGDDLTLDWRWDGLIPRPVTLHLGDLQVSLVASGSGPARSYDDGSPPSQLPSWLPHRVRIDHFDASLPCRTGQCALNGSATLDRSDTGYPVALDLQLTQASHRIDLKATLDGQPSQRLIASAQLAIDDQPTLTAETDYRADPTRHWTGTARIPDWPQAPWLVDWLQQWTPVPDDTLPSQPAAAQLDARWTLDWPGGKPLLESASGSVALQGELPQPWPVPGIGTVSGELAVDLTASHGQWQARALQSNLTLTEPAAWADALPALIRPDTVTLKTQPPEHGDKIPPGTLPMAVTLTGKGRSQWTLDGSVTLALSPPWSMDFKQTHVTGRLPTTQLGGWRLASPRLDLTLSGHADATALSLKTGPSAFVTLAGLTAPEDLNLGLDTVRGDLPSMTLDAHYRTDKPALDSLQLKGPVWLSAGQITHPQLKPQSWRFKGSLTSTLKQLSLDGQLTAHSGADAQVGLKVPFGGELDAHITSHLQAPEDSKAWAATWTGWPKLLDVTAGTVDIDTQLSRPASGPLQLDGHADLRNLDGTFNRTGWTGMTGGLSVAIKNGQLTAQMPDLSIQTVNPGVPIGPVQLAANYATAQDQPLGGQLTLQKARADLVGGQVHVEPQQWNLSRLPIRVPLIVEKLDLKRIMELYPSEDLAGTGQLSGTLPVRIGRDGIAVEDGDLQALSPGGRLELPGSRLQALAGDNMAMGIVAEAMKNFHYSVLDSTIDYARDGTLKLGLHIEGRNPDVHNGQPVVLNVNLEEDIPALLTSLQLSGRVNETVTERVKKLIEQRQNDNTKEQ
ncbi:intermembrane phospholipid transport protein YdbH family protein [Marinobacter halodurans]|nr:YdbH domain-containing protein [Marinobacter halodurans]